MVSFCHGVLHVCTNSAQYLAEDDLWGQVLWRAAQSPSPALDSFGEPKVCDL